MTRCAGGPSEAPLGDGRPPAPGTAPRAEAIRLFRASEVVHLVGGSGTAPLTRCGAAAGGLKKTVLVEKTTCPACVNFAWRDSARRGWRDERRDLKTPTEPR